MIGRCVILEYHIILAAFPSKTRCSCVDNDDRFMLAISDTLVSSRSWGPRLVSNCCSSKFTTHTGDTTFRYLHLLRRALPDPFVCAVRNPKLASTEEKGSSDTGVCERRRDPRFFSMRRFPRRIPSGTPLLTRESETTPRISTWT